MNEEFHFLEEHGHSDIVVHKDVINRIFSKDSVEKIMKDLETEEQSKFVNFHTGLMY